MGEVEIWKPIKGYEGRYEFSNLNNVKSIGRVVKNRYSTYWVGDIVLKPVFDGRYYKVNLCLNRKGKTFGIHQLVAMYHFGHIPNGLHLVVDHINDITTDNRVENLQVITQRENINKKHIKRSSKLTGVYWKNLNKKWSSKIYLNKKAINLGLFDTEEEASEYYENALKNHLLGLPIKTNIKEKSSKYKGVSWKKCCEKWSASITIEGKRTYLGNFTTEIDAHNSLQSYRKNIS